MTRLSLALVAAVVLMTGVVTWTIARSTHAGEHVPVAGGTVRLDERERRGRELFAQTCRRCHTLSAAGATARVGPNLDELAPRGLDQAFVRETIANGMLRGNGNMPARLYEGADADAVAEFVARVTQAQAAARQRTLVP